MKNKVIKYGIVIFFIVGLFLISGCTTNTSTNQAEVYLNRALNCPHEDIWIAQEEVINNAMQSDDEMYSSDGDIIIEAYKQLYADVIAEDKFETIHGAGFAIDFWSLDYDAYMSGAKIEVKEIVLTKETGNGNSYSFTSTIVITTNNKNEDVEISGTVQLDENGLVNFADMSDSSLKKALDIIWN